MGLPGDETWGRFRRTNTYCLLARVSGPSVGWVIDNEFPRPSGPGLLDKVVHGINKIMVTKMEIQDVGTILAMLTSIGIVLHL